MNRFGVLFMNQSTKKPILYVIPCNHFDLAWRRPFRTNMEYEGKTFIPYAKIEQYYIEDNIALCKKYPEYKFCIESVSVAREFLKNRPDMKEQLFALAKEGRVFIPGSGDTVIDSNLVLGETIVRNFVTGLLWAEDNFQQKNKQAFRADAFGNSAQLPQIFRGCELTHAFKLDYVEPDGIYWRGLDGSTVVCGYLANSGNGGNPYKHTPCKKCSGTGMLNGEICTECDGRGIDLEREMKFFFPFKLNEELLQRNGKGFIMLCPEEYLPKEESIKRALNFSDKYDIRFVNPEEPLQELEELFDNIDKPTASQMISDNELNPSNTGCYVTRIKSKQVMRRQEYALLGTETLASLSWLKGSEYPQNKLLSVWHDMFYMGFHDCITGTVVDAAYRELEDVRRKIDTETRTLRADAVKALLNNKDNTVTVINPFGITQSGTVFVDLPKDISSVKLFDAENDKEITVTDIKRSDEKTTVYFVVKNVAPFSVKKLYFETTENNVEIKIINKNYIENSRFRVEAGENGICSIYDKKLKKEISGSGEYNIGELIFEHDEGSPWATLSDDCKRISLKNRTRLVSVTKGNGYERMTFETRPYRGYTAQDVSVTTTVTLTEGIERVDFHSSVNWNSYNHRLRIAFPSTLKGKQVYGIPYGYNKRKSYVPEYYWSGIDGDYPAINWAGVEDGSEAFAVLNKGLPSYKVERGATTDTVFLTVLRSPTVPTFLHEPNYYSMTEWDGMRDAGRHEFDYAITAYNSSFSESNVLADAICYNAGMLAYQGIVCMPELPNVISDNVYCSSIKHAEKEDALVLRLVEYRGKHGKAEITIPEWSRGADIVNMLERKGEALEFKGGRAEINVRPFQIVTVLFKR